jgi:hypothetical protein
MLSELRNRWGSDDIVGGCSLASLPRVVATSFGQSFSASGLSVGTQATTIERLSSIVDKKIMLIATAEESLLVRESLREMKRSTAIRQTLQTCQLDPLLLLRLSGQE